MTLTSTHFSTQQCFLSLSPLRLNMAIVLKIEKALSLTFISEQQPHRVCFANQNAELQDTYKQVFTATDLLDYVYAILIAKQNDAKGMQLCLSDLANIPYPTDTLIFWKLVRIGQQYRLSLT